MQIIELKNLPVEIKDHLLRNTAEPLCICVSAKPMAVLLPYSDMLKNQTNANFYDAWLAWRKSATFDPNDDFSDVFERIRQ